MNPVICSETSNCVCYYIPNQANVFNCSGKHLDGIPSDDEVPALTEWMDFSRNQLSELCVTNVYFSNISVLFLDDNRLRSICDKTIDILGNEKLKALHLANNNLRRLPTNIATWGSSTKLWLSNNPFACACDLLWMKNWMTNKSDRTIFEDYYDIECNSGVPLYEMDPVKMGCFPKELTLWQKALIGISATVTTGVVIAIIAISRRWNEVKWFMYLHFDILDKNDGNENLNNKKKDALISYWYEIRNLITKLYNIKFPFFLWILLNWKIENTVN